MTIDRKLLEILVCPITKQPVSMLNQTQLDKINQLIEQGELHTLDGAKLASPLKQALVTQNGNTIYQIDDNIPVMLEDQSIPCEQIPDW